MTNLSPHRSGLLLRCWRCAKEVVFPTVEEITTPGSSRELFERMRVYYAHRCDARMRGELQLIGFYTQGTPTGAQGMNYLHYYGPAPITDPVAI